MTLDELKDRIFDMINDSKLPLADLELKDCEDSIHIRLKNGRKFALKCSEVPK